MSERRKPRRASAPATRDAVPDGSATPDADWTAWWASSGEKPPGARDGREQWFLDQRPPHWG